MVSSGGSWRNIVSATEGETLLEVAAYVIFIKYFVFYRPSGKLLWKKVELRLPFK